MEKFAVRSAPGLLPLGFAPHPPCVYVVNAGCPHCVVTDAELDALLTAFVAVTDATLLIGPHGFIVGAVTTIFTVADAPDVSVPISARTPVDRLEHVPCDGVHETYVVPVGSGSFTVTFDAVTLLVFVTVIVYVS